MEFLAGLFAGILVGLVAGMLAADAIVEKGKRDRGELTPHERYELACTTQADMQLTPQERDAVLWRRANPGERFPAPMYQPPVIVLAAPRAPASEQTALVR